MEEEAKTDNVWLKGHTGKTSTITTFHPNMKFVDFGSITILWSQPVGGLQILSRDNKWLWVRHVENALVCIE